MFQSGRRQGQRGLRKKMTHLSHLRNPPLTLILDLPPVPIQVASTRLHRASNSEKVGTLHTFNHYSKLYLIHVNVIQAIVGFLTKKLSKVLKLLRSLSGARTQVFCLAIPILVPFDMSISHNLYYMRNASLSAKLYKLYFLKLWQWPILINMMFNRHWTKAYSLKFAPNNIRDTQCWVSNTPLPSFFCNQSRKQIEIFKVYPTMQSSHYLRQLSCLNERMHSNICTIMFIDSCNFTIGHVYAWEIKTVNTGSQTSYLVAR